LRGESGAFLFFIKTREKGIVFAIKNAASVHAIGEHLCECALAHANRSFDNYVSWSFECGNGLQLLCSGWHGAEL
jgi:hypothetical protein